MKSMYHRLLWGTVFPHTLISTWFQVTRDFYLKAIFCCLPSSWLVEISLKIFKIINIESSYPHHSINLNHFLKAISVIPYLQALHDSFLLLHVGITAKISDASYHLVILK